MNPVKRKRRVSLHGGDLAFVICNTTLLVLIFITTLYPMLFVLSASFSEPSAVSAGKMILFPINPTLSGYEYIFQYKEIWLGYANTIFYTVAGTFLNLAFTLPCAYALSRKDMLGRGFIMTLFIVTMYFSGGLIPLFIIINSLGLYDTYWSVLLPMGISTWNVIITRTSMQGIPPSLQESAKIDGCNDLRVLWNIIIPLSYPVIAVVALYSAVGFWNMYFLPMVLTPSAKLQPLQLYLMKVVIQNSSEAMGAVQGYERLLSGAQLRYSIIMVSILPIICVYPFVQKYFIKGVMIGALKG